MALKKSFMVKTVRGDTDLELKADAGESFLVKGIYIHNPPGNAYVTLRTKRTTVGYFRAERDPGNQLAFPVGQNEYQNDDTTPSDDYRIEKFGINPNILDFMIAKGWLKGYPIPEGETFKITGAAQADAVQLVVYEVWDAGDQKEDDPNGPAATEYVFLNYGRTAATVTKTLDTLYEVSASPAEFPDFPFGKVVPEKKQITLLGIAASPVASFYNDGTDYILTNFLKLVRERKTLFDDDLKGILMESVAKTVNGSEHLFGAGLSLLGQCSDVDKRPPFVLPEPLVFVGGEEVLIYLTTTKGGAGQNLTTELSEITLIEKVVQV